MTTVIWLMYLADFAQNAAFLLTAGGVITLLVCGGYRIVFAAANEYNDERPAPIRNYVIAALVALSISAVIPSKTTIYAAAAVTAGKEALATPTGDKAVRALNAWLDRQIAGEDQKK